MDDEYNGRPVNSPSVNVINDGIYLQYVGNSRDNRVRRPRRAWG